MKPRHYRSELRDSAAAETRARILAAARELLTDNSQTAVSMETVAKRAGVTRLTVYNQFETKQGLLDAAFDEIARAGGLFELQHVMEGKDARASLLRVVEIFTRFWSEHGNAMPKLMQFKSDPEIAGNIEERQERRRHLLTALSNRLQTSASATTKKDAVDTLFALTSFEFYRHLDRTGRSPAAIEAIVRAQFESVLDRLLAAAPKPKPKPKSRKGSS